MFIAGDGEIRWRKPVVYQEKNGTWQPVGAARYVITDDNRVAFEVAKYDTSRALYIDPLIYSTYLGGSLTDVGKGIAVDSVGNAYIVGMTASTDFPTRNPLEPGNQGGYDAFVVKLNPTGTGLVYSTYLGGSGDELNDNTVGGHIAVDNEGNVYVTGLTLSADFPTTPGAFQTVCANNCSTYGTSFVTKFNSTGSALVYSTYLGGSLGSLAVAIAVDAAGNAYVTGETVSTDFPTTPGAFQTVCSNNCAGGDAFLTKFNSSGSALVYSTYLGGSGSDSPTAIVVDSSVNAYVTGSTWSTDFPTVNPVQATNHGGPSFCACDAFVTKFNSSGTKLLYSTYLGGNSFDESYGIAVDSAGSAYIVGATGSPDFPTTSGAFQTVKRGNAANEAAFVVKLSPSGSALAYSTYLAGRSAFDQNTGAFSVALDGSGSAYVTGLTDDFTFPTKNPLYASSTDQGLSGFVSRFNPSGSALVYSTFFGGSYRDYGVGIAIDNMGSAYIVGNTNGGLPVTPGAFQSTCNGSDVSDCRFYGDAFVSKILYFPTTTHLISSINPSLSGQRATFVATVSSSLGGTPTGAVTFLNGATFLGANPVINGKATLNTIKLPIGENTITAVYGGDANDVGSTSAPVNQFVLAATTSSILMSSLNPSIYGQGVTFTATVIGSGTVPPTGQVAFTWLGNSIGTATLNSSGVATLTKSNLNAYAYFLTAVYKGDAKNKGSTSPVLNQVVNPNHQHGHSHVVSESLHRRSSSHVHCEDHIAHRHGQWPRDFHSRNDNVGNGSTQRRQSNADGFVSGRGVNKGHGNLRWRLKHRQEFSFSCPNSALEPGVPQTLLSVFIGSSGLDHQLMEAGPIRSERPEQTHARPLLTLHIPADITRRLLVR